MDKPDRTRDEEDEMLHAAHASRYHWGVVGQAENRARGEWQISRVYTVLGRGGAAVAPAQQPTGSRKPKTANTSTRTTRLYRRRAFDPLLSFRYMDGHCFRRVSPG